MKVDFGSLKSVVVAVSVGTGGGGTESVSTGGGGGIDVSEVVAVSTGGGGGGGTESVEVVVGGTGVRVWRMTGAVAIGVLSTVEEVLEVSFDVWVDMFVSRNCCVQLLSGC